MSRESLTAAVGAVHLDPEKYAAPGSAEEFFRDYGGYVSALSRKLLGESGNTAQDAEDAAADIMAVLFRERAWEQYDPGYISPRTGAPVTWRAFISAKVALRMRGKREQVARHAGRELLLCDTQAEGSGTRWAELFGDQVWDDYPCLSDSEFVTRLRDHIAAVPDSGFGNRSLLHVFDELYRCVKNGEKGPALRRQLKLAAAAGENFRELMGNAARKAASAPAPARVRLAGVALSAAEARQALDLLRSAPGNHVHRALTGHRLMAEAAPGWYHEVAAEERRRFPGAEVAARSGKIGGAGAGHVKTAVIHALERLLYGVPAGQPEETSRHEVFESELWHIPGMDEARVDAVLAAARKVMGL